MTTEDYPYKPYSYPARAACVGLRAMYIGLERLSYTGLRWGDAEMVSLARVIGSGALVGPWTN